ncbi:MAG: hypothetical protein ABL934_18835 [Lysobacteraceae bacterium]
MSRMVHHHHARRRVHPRSFFAPTWRGSMRASIRCWCWNWRNKPHGSPPPRAAARSSSQFFCSNLARFDARIDLLLVLELAK